MESAEYFTLISDSVEKLKAILSNANGDIEKIKLDESLMSCLEEIPANLKDLFDLIESYTNDPEEEKKISLYTSYKSLSETDKNNTLKFLEYFKLYYEANGENADQDLKQKMNNLVQLQENLKQQ